MDVRFLREISEAYVIDSDLEQTPDQIFEDLYDIVKFLQKHDLSLYNELYGATSLKQQRILKNYLDSIYKQEEITESLAIVSSGLILGGIAALLFGKPFMRSAYRTLSSIGNFFEKFGRRLSKMGKYWQIRCAIIYENTRKCYTSCGITKPADIKLLTPLTIKTSSSIGGAKSIEQGRCLRECYIEELINLIALHMENYFVCLKRTGSFEAIQKTDSDDIIRMISSTNIAAVCESYYNAAREALDNFYRVLELVYDSHFEEDKRLEKVNRLRSKIYETRQIVQKASNNDMRRYDNKEFPAQIAQQPQIQQKMKKSQIGGQHYNYPNFRRN